MRQAVQLDICADLPKSLIFDDLYPTAALPGGKAVGYGFYGTGLGYNKEVFAKNGWAAPTSWKDLEDPKYKGVVSIGPISGYGIEALLMLNRANGGNETNIEPGFQAMAEKVAPNVMAWEASPATLGQMMLSGEAALVVWGSIRVQPLIDQGAPVGFVYPKEGALQAMGAACVIKGGSQSKLAEQFLETLLSPDAQTNIAKLSGWGPANSKVKLDPDVAKGSYTENNRSMLGAHRPGSRSMSNALTGPSAGTGGRALNRSARQNHKINA